ncbi:MAG: hypothetical protein M3O31_08260 [Acidobacteriota bacterium]|nr:hypothetical protein [Acidobacteriota bacterium]
MQKVYRAILRLYPAKYRAAFALEMMEVFDQASRDFRKRGLLNLVWFATCELIGLVKALVSEHAANWAAQEAY